MALTPSQRPTREWPLLILTLAVVGLVCFPLWQAFGADDLHSFLSWGPQRWARLLLGPEQFACYVCFLWSILIFASRYWETWRQRGALSMGLLPIEEGARILQEDARPLMRKVDQALQRKGPFILANMIQSALSRYALTKSSEEVREAVRSQTTIEHGRLASGSAMLNYLAWAIPALGFFGTVRGLAGSMTLAGQGGDQLQLATSHLTVAFDCTLVALGLSLVVMFLIHVLQRYEEDLVTDCQQYCLEHMVNRIYQPDHPHDLAGRNVPFLVRDGSGLSMGEGLGERISR